MLTRFQFTFLTQTYLQQDHPVISRVVFFCAERQKKD